MKRIHAVAKGGAMSKADIMDYLCAVGILETKRRIYQEELETVNDKQTYRNQDYQFRQLLKNFLIFAVLLLAAFFICYFLVLNFIGKLIPSLNSTTFTPALIAIFSILAFLYLAGYILLIMKTKYLSELRQYAKDYHIFSFKKRKEIIINQITVIYNFVKDIEDELEKAYSLDILYSSYRNLDAVCRMYEYFLSGSVDTLKEAINKYDNESRLDDIRNSINGITELNRTMYHEMLKQTDLMQQQLNYAAQTARNTQITALNTGLLLMLEQEREYKRMY